MGLAYQIPTISANWPSNFSGQPLIWWFTMAFWLNWIEQSWQRAVTLQEINISHLGKRKIIFKYALSGGYVNSLEGNFSAFFFVVKTKVFALKDLTHMGFFVQWACMRFPFALPKKRTWERTWVFQYPFSEGRKTSTEGFPICVILLVGGFNPIEKYESKWESSPILGVKTKNIWVATTQNRLVDNDSYN